MPFNIKILIVEDELLIAESISEILLNAGYSNIRITSNAEEAITEIEKELPDIVFSDIALGSGKTGIELGRTLNEKYKIPFIYITSHFSAQIVQQAKQTSPKAYLTKPFKKEDLLIALELGLYQQENENSIIENLVVKDGHDTVKISCEEILWIKAEGNYTVIYPVSAKARMVRESITDILGRIPSREIIRIHKSYAVNFKFVTEVKSTKILLKDLELPIGRAYRQSLQEYLNQDR